MDIVKEQEAWVYQLKDEEGKNIRKANISTYEGKDKDGKSKYSSWPARFVGAAFDKSGDLKEKDQIILTSAKIENEYAKEKDKLYINLIVFDFKKKLNDDNDE